MESSKRTRPRVSTLIIIFFHFTMPIDYFESTSECLYIDNIDLAGFDHILSINYFESMSECR